MIFKCKNCGGNTVYSPEKHIMICPYCDSEESDERQEPSSAALDVCPNCGGHFELQEHTSAMQCPFCENYLIFNERVEGAFAPRLIIPFQVGKETCKGIIRGKFKKYRFAPTDFLSETRLNETQGMYVPYWFYDYDVNADFKGEGTKTRSWTSGNVQYTEHSFYDVERNLDYSFRKIPVDASVQMPDDVMDLMEPYDYQQLDAFKPEYLSGFFAEKYNMNADVVEFRGRQKMMESVSIMTRNTYSEYSGIRELRNQTDIRNHSDQYGLLPVWRYLYSYKGTTYPYYVNGQTGKVVGTAPVSKGKVWAYAGTLWLCLTLLLSISTAILRML